jgi:hypothetical protein
MRLLKQQTSAEQLGCDSRHLRRIALSDDTPQSAQTTETSFDRAEPSRSSRDHIPVQRIGHVPQLVSPRNLYYGQLRSVRRQNNSPGIFIHTS